MNKRQRNIDIISRVLLSLLTLGVLSIVLRVVINSQGYTGYPDDPIPLESICLCGGLISVGFTIYAFSLFLSNWHKSIWCILMGGHFYGGWEYRHPGTCEQVQICFLDGQSRPETRVDHHWREWEQSAAHPCVQTRRCAHCDLQESRTRHNWQGWHYARAGSCDQVRICSQCAQEEPGFGHNWSPWESRGSTTCSRTCKQCSSEEEQNHRWQYLRTDYWDEIGPGQKYDIPRSLEVYQCADCHAETPGHDR